ncbi:MAG: WXG100 family type VII secretion target [Lachnospiraceae bacterium]|nr:WXG100 family type VII secretion target [Lachnospiraceae bacterium]
MAKQQVNAVKLKKAGSELAELSAKINQQVMKMDEDIKKVSSIWSSEAAKTYIQSYNDDVANFDELVKITSQMGATLQQISENYQKADDKAMDVIGKHLAKG